MTIENCVTRRLMIRGDLGPAQRVAGRWLLEEAAVRAFADAQRAKSND